MLVNGEKKKEEIEDKKKLHKYHLPNPQSLDRVTDMSNLIQTQCLTIVFKQQLSISFFGYFYLSIYVTIYLHSYLYL